MISTEVNPTLADQLRELRLPAFRDNYEPLARQAEQETLSYEQYLQELAIRECETRRVNRIETMLRQSKLPLESRLALRRLAAATLEAHTTAFACQLLLSSRGLKKPVNCVSRFSTVRRNSAKHHLELPDSETSTLQERTNGSAAIFLWVWGIVANDRTRDFLDATIDRWISLGKLDDPLMTFSRQLIGNRLGWSD